MENWYMNAAATSSVENWIYYEIVTATTAIKKLPSSSDWLWRVVLFPVGLVFIDINAYS